MAGHLEPRRNKDGSVSWRISVTVGYGRAARRVTRVACRTERMPANGKPPAKALALLRQMEREAESGFLPPAHLMLADVLNRWLDNHADIKLAPKTAYGYRCVVESHLIPAFLRFRAVDLRPATMQDYYALKREEGLSDAAIHYHYRTMHAALAWGVGMELLARNVCDVKEAKPPRGKAAEMRTLTAPQMLGLLDAVKGTEIALAVTLAVATGMRRGEVLGLVWGDVDLARGTVRVTSALSAVPGRPLERKGTKTERVRTVALPAFAVTALKAERKGRVCPPDAYVVPGLHPDRLTRLWREVVKSLSLEGVRFHDLRHSYATLLLEQGVEVRAVQEALGHTQATTTMNVYAHVTERMREHRAEALDSAFAAPPEHLGSTLEVQKLPVEKTGEQ
jgi:integrase